MTTSEPLLLELGARVRALREGAGVSRQSLAERSGLSLRFLAGVEGGSSNISVLNLAALARALGTTPVRLLGGVEGRAERTESSARPSDPFASPPRQLLAHAALARAARAEQPDARRLRVRFVELDSWIEEAAGLSLSEIFSVHGEGYYRRLEREALEKVLAQEGGVVIAAGGSLVTAPLMQRTQFEEHVGTLLRAQRLLPTISRGAQILGCLSNRGSKFPHHDHVRTPMGIHRLVDQFGAHGDLRLRMYPISLQTLGGAKPPRIKLS